MIPLPFLFQARFLRRFPSVIAAALLILMIASGPASAGGASSNIDLDSPIYRQIEKLNGFGILDSLVQGLRPISRTEAARLIAEGESNLPRLEGEGREMCEEILLDLRQKIGAVVETAGGRASPFEFEPVASARGRFVHLDGVPRNYDRDVFLAGGAKAFGFIGGDLRPLGGGVIHKSGSEGTPLLENNEGTVYRRGANGELIWTTEAGLFSLLRGVVEPQFLVERSNATFRLRKGYLKLGGGGLELEAGRDANWFGPGDRGALTLTDNARNFNIVKLSSPEPIDIGWIRQYLGFVKYSFILSRFEETGEGRTLRRPYFIGIKLAVKPASWVEIGGNFARQEGGPGFSGDPSVQDYVFGGGYTNHSNSISGLDLRFRLPWLRGTEIYGEFAGEDSAKFWPILESYIGGIFIPRLTPSGRDDFRFEYFWGHAALYSDGKFPSGYTYHGLSPGHPQGGAAQDFFCRYNHYFSSRNLLGIEYFHTDRGKIGRVFVDGVRQSVERRDGGRIRWSIPLTRLLDGEILYGWERIENLNLVGGASRSNQLLKLDIMYRY
jgi:hypothetical protein